MFKKIFSSLTSSKTIPEENYLSEQKPAFYFTVAGSFSERQNLIQKKSFKKFGDRYDLTLIPEPENPFDKNAIIIYAKRYGQIGYVPATIAEQVNDFIITFPNYALNYETVAARPFDPNDNSLNVEIKLYAIELSESIISSEQKAEMVCDFTDLESTYINVVKSLYPQISLSALKEKNYILIKWAGHDFLKLKIGKRLQYALIQNNLENLDQIDLVFEEPNKIESGHVRITLSSPDDIIKLKPYLNKQEVLINQKILWFDQLYSEMSKIK